MSLHPLALLLFSVFIFLIHKKNTFLIFSFYLSHKPTSYISFLTPPPLAWLAAFMVAADVVPFVPTLPLLYCNFLVFFQGKLPKC